MNLNKVMLMGYVGQDPKITETQNGKVAAMQLATTYKGYTTKTGVEVPDRTEWHNIVMYGKIADVAERYIHKGSPLYIEGRLKTRSYEDSTKTKRWITEIIVDEMQMLPKSNG